MNTLHLEHKVHDAVEHLKVNWAETVILAIFCVALLLLVLSSSVSYG
ncbi:MAG: hypothetical protein ACRBDX_03665 [Gammaproteobacteria bacterium]